MIDSKGFRLFDFLDFVVKRKELLLAVFLSSLVVTYFAVYFLVEEKFEATAVIIPREEDVQGTISGILRSTRGLPFGLGAKSQLSEIDLYETIIFSRTLLEEVIRKFDLLRQYDIDTTKVGYMEGAVEILQKEVRTRVTPESAFLVSVQASTRERSAEMTNFVVVRVNETIVDLKARSSRENRMFLEKRVADVTNQLKAAEDSLRAFQERTGLLDAKVQLEEILTTHTKLESELAAVEVKRGILDRIMGQESPQVRDLEIQIQEIRKKLGQLRAKGEPGSPVLGLKKLPQTAAEFVRRYRDVEINGLILEYVVPLYEQAKIEEKKDIPVLQVIDYAVPPAKKSFPPRTIFALLGAISVTTLVILILIGREMVRTAGDSKWLSLFREARRWRWK
ncbi:MAG: hypothetical protein HYW57_05450 [Ignavibacteriales bacterium]|nr:hypothetical protein [Ignavibacteriales bacterium]